MKLIYSLQNLPHLESDVKKYESILKVIDRITDSRTKLEHLRAELFWSRVVALEKKVTEATQNFEKAKEQFIQGEKRTEAVKQNLVVAKSESEKYTAELAEINQSKGLRTAELEDRRRAMDETKRKFREIEVIFHQLGACMEGTRHASKSAECKIIHEKNSFCQGRREEGQTSYQRLGIGQACAGERDREGENQLGRGMEKGERTTDKRDRRS